jgi:phosphotransferase system enzyme I (PtsP)
LQLTGVGLAEGIALGHVVLHEPRVVITNIIADDIPKELERLDAAVEILRADLDTLLTRGDVADGGEHRDVLEAFRMFANDRGWMRRMREAVMTGLTAEAAVERVESDTRARMMRQTDPVLRERLHDLDDLASRLMRQLTGQGHAPAKDRLPENAVLVARTMGPAALLDYDRARVRGLVLEEGGPTSHVSIVARALGIASVGQIANAAGLVDSGDAIIVDGVSGEVHVRPPADIERAYAEKARFRARRQAQYAALRDRPCVTRDGEEITLLINAGLLVDLPHIQESGAAGIGLFRTELQFMVAAAFPRTREQFQLYGAVLDAAGERPVTFRTLDVGGDKVLPYMRVVEEENPALGWRAIRLGLDRPGLLRSQIRALLRAAAGRRLRMMFPMVSTIDEFDRGKAFVEHELTHLRRHGHTLPEQIEIGTMLEVPALLFQLDEILQRVDFLSVGSNDLVQFLFAADRGNSWVADRFDPISVPVLRALREVIRKGREHGKPITLCGELASRPIGALALVALGFRHLSLSPSAVGPIKSMLLDLDVSRAADLVNELLDGHPSHVSIREQLAGFAALEGLQF